MDILEMVERATSDMTNTEFRAWAADHNLDAEVLAQVEDTRESRQDACTHAGEWIGVHGTLYGFCAACGADTDENYFAP